MIDCIQITTKIEWELAKLCASYDGEVLKLLYMFVVVKSHTFLTVVMLYLGVSIRKWCAIVFGCEGIKKSMIKTLIVLSI